MENSLEIIRKNLNNIDVFDDKLEDIKHNIDNIIENLDMFRSRISWEVSKIKDESNEFNDLKEALWKYMKEKGDKEGWDFLSDESEIVKKVFYEKYKCNIKSYKHIKELENNTEDQFIKSVPRSDSLTLDLIEKMVEILRVIKKHKHNREYDLKNYCKEELYLTEEQYVKIINELIRLKKITIEYHIYCPRCDECYGYYDSKDKIPKEMFCEECDKNISEDYYVIKYFV